MALCTSQAGCRALGSRAAVLPVSNARVPMGAGALGYNRHASEIRLEGTHHRQLGHKYANSLYVGSRVEECVIILLRTGR